MAAPAPAHLRARLAVDPLFGIDVAVRDAYPEVAERYADMTGDTRKLGTDRLSNRLQEMWRDGRRDLVRQVLRTPYQGGINPVEIDQAAEELSRQYGSTRMAGEKSWVGDIISVVIDLAESGGDLGGSAEAEAEERRKAEAREAARRRLQTVTIAAGAVGLLVVAAFIFNRSR